MSFDAFAFSYDTITEKFPRVLSAKDLEYLVPKFKQARTVEHFIDTYQSKFKFNSEAMTFSAIAEACIESQGVMMQYPTHEKRIKDLAKDIFITSRWLKQPLVIASVEGRSDKHLIGGRHRLHAIAAVFAQVATAIDKKHAETIYDGFMGQYCDVHVYNLESIDDLFALVEADNASRVMRGAEMAHLKLQVIGAAEGDGISTDIAQDVLTNNALAPKEKAALMGQVFTRQYESPLPKQTLQELGQKVATKMLFELSNGRLTTKSRVKYDASEAQALMERAYKVALDVVGTRKLKTGDYVSVAEEIVSRCLSSVAKSEFETHMSDSVDDSKASTTKRQPTKKATTKKQPKTIEDDDGLPSGIEDEFGSFAHGMSTPIGVGSRHFREDEPTVAARKSETTEELAKQPFNMDDEF